MPKHAEQEAVRSYLLPFLRLDRHIPWLTGASSPDALAAVTGMTVTELDQELGRLDEHVRQTALEMLKEDDIPEWLPRLPFKPGERLLAFGDSTVDDRQGWFPILSRVLDVGIPDGEFTFLNAGTAWQTTSEALRRVQSDLIDMKPDWVFLSIGMFDAIRLKALPDRTLVPLSETWENLNAIESVVRSVTSRPPVWIVPHPVLEDVQEDLELFDFTLSMADLRQIQQLVAGKTGYIVDPLAHRFGRIPETWNYIADGLHASLSGHAATVREVLWSMLRQEEKVRREASS